MVEIIVGLSLFILCFLLIRYKFYIALTVGLILSVLLHKELFSIYIWDLLPIRIFMVAFLLSSLLDFYKFNKFTSKFLSYLKDPFIVINLLLVLSKLVSIFNSLSINSSIFLNIFFINISVFLITIYIRLKDIELLNLMKNYVFISVVMSLITFVQLYFYFQYSFLFGAVLNVAGRSVDVPEFSFSATYLTDVLKILVMTRVGSLFWDVNHFGGFIASTLILAFAFLLTSKNKRNFIFYLFSFLTLGLVLFLTNSRSAWILSFISFFIFFISLIYRKVGRKGIIYAFSLLTALTIFLTFQYQDRDSWFREKVKSYFHYRLDSFDSHFLLLRGTVNVFDKFQLIGGGVGSFFEHFKSTETADEFLRRDPAGLSVKVPAHTIWGESLAETGLFGTTVFILLVILLLGSAIYAVMHSDKEDFIFSSALLGLIMGWLVAGIFYSYNSEFFYICLLVPFFYIYKKLNLNLNLLLEYFNKKSIFGFSIIMLICFYLLFIGLGTNKFIPFDEAIYAKVAKNMYESGDYFTLRWYPESYWFEKPPLYFIVTSFFYSIFGVNEFAARLFTAISSVILLFVTYKFSKLIFSNSRAAVFTVVALITNVSYLYYSRVAMLDIIFTLFIITSSYFFIKYQSSLLTRHLIYSGIMVGLAVMTKNIIGLFPLGFFGIYYLIKIFKDKSLFWLSFKNLFLIFFSAIAVSLPWHYHMYSLYGMEFINSYFGYHLFQRFGTVIEQKGGPWYFYFLVIQNSMRLWYGALILGLVYFIYRIYKEKFNENYMFLVYSSLLILLIFSYSSSKLRWYIIPIYPFLSIIAGFFIAEIVSLIDRFVRKPAVTFLSSFLIFVASFYYLYTVKGMVYTSDLTGRMVEMVLLNNNQIINKADIVFIDKVDLPLILFYSEKKYQSVLYTSLRLNLQNYKANQTNATFITSQSRFLDIQRLIPEVTKIGENKDYVLGSLKLD
jgi:4-amino-4-deoxy-L-arabinose transferase-like glycosyltransferase